MKTKQPEKGKQIEKKVRPCFEISFTAIVVAIIVSIVFNRLIKEYVTLTESWQVVEAVKIAVDQCGDRYLVEFQNEHRTRIKKITCNL